jgi:hypothetical protein
MDALVSGFLIDGIARRERCLLASSSGHSNAILRTLHARGLPVGELTTSGALVVADVEQFYRPSGRHDPQESLALVCDVARQARADGFNGLRGAGGPLAWAGLDDDERRAVGSYEAQVTEVLRKERVAALCLYDERSAGVGPLQRMLRTHPQAILDGRLCTNPFCGALDEEDDARQVEWMLRALRRDDGGQDLAGGGPAGQPADDVDRGDPAGRGPLTAEAGRLAIELGKLRRREAARAEEVESRNALLRAMSRQLDPQVQALELALRAVGDPTSTEAPPSGWRDSLEQLRDSAANLRRLAQQLESASSFVAGTPPPVPQASELTALAAATMESWRRARHIEGTDVRLQASNPVTGCWDIGRIGSIVQQVLETAWDRSWGSPVDMYVEDLGIKARLTAIYEDMEVLAGTPFDGPGSQGGDLVAHARDSLRVALWTARESIRGMGGAMGLSVWPDGRVSVTIDLPRG